MRGDPPTIFLTGGLERVSSASIKRFSSRFISAGSPPSGGIRTPGLVPAGYVARDTMSLQLPDAISVNALLSPVPNLSADSLAARYNFGDQVVITCQLLPARP